MFTMYGLNRAMAGPMGRAGGMSVHSAKSAAATAAAAATAPVAAPRASAVALSSLSSRRRASPLLPPRRQARRPVWARAGGGDGDGGAAAGDASAGDAAPGAEYNEGGTPLMSMQEADPAQGDSSAAAAAAAVLAGSTADAGSGSGSGASGGLFANPKAQAAAGAALAALALAVLSRGPAKAPPALYPGWRYSLAATPEAAVAEAQLFASGGAAAAVRQQQQQQQQQQHREDGIGAARDWLVGRGAYALQQVSAANVACKILFLMSLGAPVIAAAAAVYRRAAGGNVSYSEALYKCYCLIWRVPGIGLAKEPTPASYVVANAIFLAGVFTFAIVLGLVSDEIKTSFRDARSGNYPVRASGHVLLLNWSAQTPALLRQIASAQATGRGGGGGALSPLAAGGARQVVILADKPKAQMDELVRETLRAYGAQLEVHTRQGSPYKLADLRRVGADRAATVLLLHPEKAEPATAEAMKAAAGMCLTALEGAPKGQRVVAQIPGDGGGAAAAYLASLEATASVAGRNFSVAALPETRLLNRIVAASAAQPGTLSVWTDILSPHGASPQFTCAPVPDSLAGAPFDAARRAYVDSVLLGYLDADGAARLNPAGNAPLPAGARLVLLGRTANPQPQLGAAATPYTEAAARAKERFGRARSYKSKPRSIIVAGWPEDGVAELIDGFADLTAGGSDVTIVLSKPANPKWPTKKGGCRFTFVEAQALTQPKVLLEAGIKTADAVVVGAGAGASGSDAEADARALAALMQVQDAVMQSKRRDAPHVVVPIRRFSTSKLARQYLETLAAEAAATAERGGAAAAVVRSPEFINASDVLSGVLTQVVAEPSYGGLMRELLFSREGQELYLRSPAAFNVPAGGPPVTFAELAEAARLAGQTALGYVRGGGGGTRMAVLAPHAGHQIMFGPDDKVVVVAEEF